MSEGGRVPAATLVRVFWRCLFLQAAWNRRGMQNLGFAYAIDPALRRLYPEPERRADALRRHLGFFNCHPYMAAAILGGAIHHEERVAVGAEAGGGPLAYKSALQGPLAALGDGFFWTALRPFAGALGAAGALVVGWPGVVLAVLFYNAVHLALRIELFRAGYAGGDEVLSRIAGLGLPVLADRLRGAGAVLCAVAGAAVVLRATGPAGATGAALAAVSAVVGYVAMARGTGILPTAYLVVGVAVGVAFLAGRLMGGG
jgi:PTS system mannose-specific IID component